MVPDILLQPFLSHDSGARAGDAERIDPDALNRNKA
jgi:hypothetical protein